MKKDSISIPDIRNKLSPITILLEMIENRDEFESMIPDQIQKVKVMVNYLSNKKVY